MKAAARWRCRLHATKCGNCRQRKNSLSTPRHQDDLVLARSAGQRPFGAGCRQRNSKAPPRFHLYILGVLSSAVTTIRAITLAVPAAVRKNGSAESHDAKNRINLFGVFFCRGRRQNCGSGAPSVPSQPCVDNQPFTCSGSNASAAMVVPRRACRGDVHVAAATRKAEGDAR